MNIYGGIFFIEAYFLNCIGIERPDIRQLGILSFATIVHNAYFDGILSESSFDKYVRKYFDLFLGMIYKIKPFDLLHSITHKNHFICILFSSQRVMIMKTNYYTYKQWVI